MKTWIGLIGADAVMCWWLVNSILMLWRPGVAREFLWWPEFRVTRETPASVVLSRRKIRILGVVFALGSGAFLTAVLVPATVGLILLHLNS
jgi:hypothetical protein